MANPTGKGGWKPGQSGNPGGMTSDQRNRRAENLNIFLTQVSAATMRKVAKRIIDGAKNGRLEYIKLFLDYTLGKPSQAVDITTQGEAIKYDYRNMTDEQLKTIETILISAAANSEVGPESDPS